MPALLLSPTFWKFLGVGALLIAAGLFYWHYEAISAEAAQVPQLKSQIEWDNTRALQLSQRLSDITTARNKADQALSTFQAGETAVIASLKKASLHAAAQVNPLCAPSDGDRGLRNAALSTLVGTGQATGAVGVPSAPVKPD